MMRMHPIPDNSELIELLNTFNLTPDYDEYAVILKTLEKKDFVLLLPAIQDHTSGIPELRLRCLFDVNGISVFAAFTSVVAMHLWAKEQISWIPLSLKEILKLAGDNKADRIVIDSHQTSEFTILAHKESYSRQVESSELALLQIPPNPLIDFHKALLAVEFLQIPEVVEGFQFQISGSDTPSISIGVKLSDDSPDVRKSCFEAVRNAFKTLKAPMHIDVMFLTNDEWYHAVQKLSGSMFFKRPPDH